MSGSLFSLRFFEGHHSLGKNASFEQRHFLVIPRQRESHTFNSVLKSKSEFAQKAILCGLKENTVHL